MAAPTPTARQTPNGVKMGQGYQVLLTLSADPDAAFWEEEVTPPGVEGGDAVVTTTQHNVDWITKAPASLAEMTDVTAKVSYDPAFIAAAVALVNVSNTVTVTFPDGSTLAAYGYLKSFIPGSMMRGSKPDATITIVFTNQDPTTCEEESPVYTPGSGTNTVC